MGDESTTFMKKRMLEKRQVEKEAKVSAVSAVGYDVVGGAAGVVGALSVASRALGGGPAVAKRICKTWRCLL